MWLYAQSDRKVCDGSKVCGVGIIPKGLHEVEIIDPPEFASDRDKREFAKRSGDWLDFRWLVLKGTLIGASLHFWNMWKNSVFPHQVNYGEDPKKLTPQEGSTDD